MNIMNAIGLFGNLKCLTMSGVLFAGMAVNAWAADFSAGTGTVEDPYVISTADELNAVRNNLSAHYQMGADIDLADWINANSPDAGWLPIGTSDAPFIGTFDGNGHAIENIWVETSEANAGLFGVIGGDVSIQELGVIVADGRKVSGGSNVGILVGLSTGVGGTKQTLIQEVYVSGNVESKGTLVGGIVGRNNNQNITILNSYAKGNVYATGDGVGGIIGSSYGSCTTLVDRCYALNNITVDGGGSTGGIMGTVSAPDASGEEVTGGRIGERVGVHGGAVGADGMPPCGEDRGGGGAAGSAAQPGQVAGKAAHPAGDHQNAQQNQQDAARLGGITKPVHVAAEEPQHLAGKQPYQQERQHKPQRIYTDQHKAQRPAVGRTGQQQHAGEGRAHAGGPGKAEGKAHDQRGDRPHSPAIQAERQAQFFVGNAAEEQLPYPHQQHDNAARHRERGAVPAKKLPQRGKAHPQQEEREADAHHKEKGVQQCAPPRRRVQSRLRRAARQITQIQRHQRQHTGREETQQPLKKHGKRRNAGLQIKSHTNSFRRARARASVPPANRRMFCISIAHFFPPVCDRITPSGPTARPPSAADASRIQENRRSPSCEGRACFLWTEYTGIV